MPDSPLHGSCCGIKSFFSEVFIMIQLCFMMKFSPCENASLVHITLCHILSLSIRAHLMRCFLGIRKNGGGGAEIYCFKLFNAI